MRLPSTPLRSNVRTTAPARAPDSSQLLGNCAVAIGALSVWPSTITGCLRSPAMMWAILPEQRLGLRLDGGRPESKNTPSVSNSTTSPRRRTVTLTFDETPSRLASALTRSRRRSSSSCSALARRLSSLASVVARLLGERGLGIIAGSGGVACGGVVSVDDEPVSISFSPPVTILPENDSDSDAASASSLLVFTDEIANSTMKRQNSSVIMSAKDTSQRSSFSCSSSW